MTAPGWEAVAHALHVPAGAPRDVLGAVCRRVGGSASVGDRVQVALAATWGVRPLLGPDRPDLDDYPLLDPPGPRRTALDAAWRALTRGPPAEALTPALQAHSDWAMRQQIPGCRAPHPSMLPPGGPGRCGACAWGQDLGGRTRCRRVSRLVPGEGQGCVLWEPPLTDDSCGPCGACCRGAFSHVPLPPSDPFATLHPEHVVPHPTDGHALPHPCPHLSAQAPWRCGVYATRPVACRAFERGSDACLGARIQRGVFDSGATGEDGNARRAGLLRSEALQ